MVFMFKVLCLLFPLLSLGQDGLRGEKLYGSCLSCHGDRGQGGQQQKTPRIGGQHDWYIVDSLKGFQEAKREEVEGRPHRDLNEGEREDLGAYISGLLTREGEE